MRLHRFYTGDSVRLEHDFWLDDPTLLHQWQKVFRFTVGDEVVLFDGKTHDRLYRIIKLDKTGSHLECVTDFERNVPSVDLYLFWSLLKKDKNDWVLQKATELGVSHFVPLLAKRSEKTGFNMERAEKIIVEAAEQCGRSDIPSTREPMLVETALNDYSKNIELFIAQQGSAKAKLLDGSRGVLIGPEGGWSEEEKNLFNDQNIMHLNLGKFTLRAETAAVVATAKLLQ